MTGRQVEYAADEWRPGEPLYQRPTGGFSGEQHVRTLFQLIEDEEVYERLWLMAYDNGTSVRCVECLVGWHPSEGQACWACGQTVSDYEFRRARSIAAKWQALGGRS